MHVYVCIQLNLPWFVCVLSRDMPSTIVETISASLTKTVFNSVDIYVNFARYFNIALINRSTWIESNESQSMPRRYKWLWLFFAIEIEIITARINSNKNVWLSNEKLKYRKIVWENLFELWTDKLRTLPKNCLIVLSSAIQKSKVQFCTVFVHIWFFTHFQLSPLFSLWHERDFKYSFWSITFTHNSCANGLCEPSRCDCDRSLNVSKQQWNERSTSKKSRSHHFVLLILSYIILYKRNFPFR